MSDCLFCKLANGAIPTEFLWEDEKVVAFRDIDPQAPVHLLVVPKQHIPSPNDLGPTQAELVGHIVGVGILCARQAGIAETDRGFRLVFNNGPEGGQSVGHLHLHVLGGRQLHWPPG